ncbi:hypothetical protein [Bacillus sp. T3]|uniref:hypothetical protein n=1 Tax=Bacillus sp. T3 TaxID=467262 RepID=UPI0029817764|nr:hypothetical protein [Bacillus sp. T3]
MKERAHPLFLIRGVIFITAFIFYILNLIFPTTRLIEVCLNTTAILLLVSALIGVSRFYFVLSVSFLVSSLFLTYYYHGLWSQITEGFSLMLKLILFIGMIPLISVPVDDQIGMIQKLIRVLNQKVSSFKVCHISSFLLANFINMAALPISKSIFYHKGTEPAETVNAQLSFRSFGLAMMCSPIGAAIALAVDISGTTWLSLLSINLCLVAIGLWLSFFFTKKDRLRSEQNKLSQQIQLEKQDYLSLLTIFLPFCVYFSFLLVSERFFSSWHDGNHFI